MWDSPKMIKHTLFAFVAVAVSSLLGSNCNSDSGPNSGADVGVAQTDGGKMRKDAGALKADTTIAIINAELEKCWKFLAPNNPARKVWRCTGTYLFECTNPTFATIAGQCVALCDGGKTIGQVQSSNPDHFTTKLEPFTTKGDEDCSPFP